MSLNGDNRDSYREFVCDCGLRWMVQVDPADEAAEPEDKLCPKCGRVGEEA